MPPTIDSKYLLFKVINKCPIVPSSRLDRTIKGIINNLEKKYKDNLIIYLNKLRIIYYLKRLTYRNLNKAKEYKGKLGVNNPFNKGFTNTLFRSYYKRKSKVERYRSRLYERGRSSVL